MAKAIKRKREMKHVVLQAPYMDLVCYHCGEEYPWGRNVLPASINIANAVLKEFGKNHRYCKKSPAGEELRVMMMERWDRWMENNPEGREEWEASGGGKWVKGSWKNKEGQ